MDWDSRRMEAVLRRDCVPLGELALPWERLSGKRVFITGATGTIGRYFSGVLRRINQEKGLGMTLCLFCRRTPPEPPGGDAHWVQGNLAEAVLRVDVEPDIILHAASPASPQAIRADPAGLPEANILATHSLLERADKSGAVLVYFSSSVVCEARDGPISELPPLALADRGPGFSLYGACKAAGELLCEKFRLERGTDCRIVRLFNINGPGMPLDSGRCFPDFLRQLTRDGKILVTGSGTALRDCCDLRDLAGGLLYVLMKGEPGVYNIGNEDNVHSMLELARLMAGLYPRGEVLGPLCETPDGSGHSLIPDTGKLRRLGWRPQVDLEACVRRCMECRETGGNDR